MFYLYETEKYKERLAHEAMAETQQQLLLSAMPRQAGRIAGPMSGLLHVIGHTLLAIGRRLDRFEAPQTQVRIGSAATSK